MYIKYEKSKEIFLVYCIFNSNIGNIADGLGLLEIVPTATSIEPFIYSKKVKENRIIGKNRINERKRILFY